MKRRYDTDFLKSLTKDIELIGTYENLTGKSDIEFICPTCKSNTFEKFQNCVYRGFFCMTCAKVRCSEKKRQTNISRFGVDWTSQSPVVKEKQRQTNLLKYGYEWTNQHPEVRQKQKDTNILRYGFENPFQSLDVRDKVKNTNILRRGVEYPTQSAIVRDKIKNVVIERYGVEYISQSPEIREKIEQTNMERYNVTCPAKAQIFKDKTKTTTLSRYGVEHTLQVKEFRDKGIATNLVKYGVEHSAQNPIIADKTQRNAYNLKSYALPSGKILNLQGYEPFALDHLLTNEKLHEDDIITQRSLVPEIWWLDVDNKRHRHFVDIFIPSQRRCIEVKSTWTYAKKTDQVLLKQQFAEQMDLLYEIWIFDKDGNLVVE